jgi:hypothetical protein
MFSMTDHVDAMTTESAPAGPQSREGVLATVARDRQPVSDTRGADREPVDDTGAHAIDPVEETVDAEPVSAAPVLVEARPVARVGAGVLPAVQAVAVAATSFVAGAATLALLRRHAARRLARSGRVQRRPLDTLPVVGSRTFIVDVHLLAKPGE